MLRCVLHFVSLCSFHLVYPKCVWRLKIRLLVLKSLLLSIVSILLWLTVLHFTWLITTALNVISFHCCSALLTDSGFDRERRGSQPDSLLWCWSHKKCDFQPRLTWILAFLNKARLALLPERQWVLLIHTQQVKPNNNLIIIQFNIYWVFQDLLNASSILWWYLFDRKSMIRSSEPQSSLK